MCDLDLLFLMPNIFPTSSFVDPEFCANPRFSRNWGREFQDTTKVAALSLAKDLAALADRLGAPEYIFF